MRANTFAGQVVAVLSRRASAFELDSAEPQTFPGRLQALLSSRRRTDTAALTSTGAGQVTTVERSRDAPETAEQPGDRTVSDALTQAIYEQHGHAVRAYATKLTGDRATADDILQETLLRARRHPEVLVNGKELVRAWLLTVVGRIVADRVRPREWDHADQLIDAMDVVEALQKLSKEQREVIEQLYNRGCTLQEASEALGVPEGTVKSHALRALWKSLGGGGVTREGTT